MNTKTHKIAIAAFLFLITGTIEMHHLLKYILLAVAIIELVILVTQLYISYKKRQFGKE